LPLCLLKVQVMRTYGGREAETHVFLTAAVDQLRTAVWALQRRRISCPFRETRPNFSVVQSVNYWLYQPHCEEILFPTSRKITFEKLKFEKTINICCLNVHGAGFPQRRQGIRSQVRFAWFLVDKVVLGHVFSEYFGFPCQFSFHILLHTH
jgi:hypothetical protein